MVIRWSETTDINFSSSTSSPFLPDALSSEGLSQLYDAVWNSALDTNMQLRLSTPRNSQQEVGILFLSTIEVELWNFLLQDDSPAAGNWRVMVNFLYESEVVWGTVLPRQSKQNVRNCEEISRKISATGAVRGPLLKRHTVAKQQESCTSLCFQILAGNFSSL